MSKYAAALDFGSSKIALAVGEKTDSGVKIVSYYDAPSAGIESGEIVNDFKVEEVVRALVEKAKANSNEIVANAQQWAADLKNGASSFVDTIMNESDEILAQSIEDFSRNLNKVRIASQQLKSATAKKNG